MLQNNYLVQAISLPFILYLNIDVRVGGRHAKGNMAILLNRNAEHFWLLPSYVLCVIITSNPALGLSF